MYLYGGMYKVFAEHVHGTFPIAEMFNDITHCYLSPTRFIPAFTSTIFNSSRPLFTIIASYSTYSKHLLAYVKLVCTGV